MTGRAGAAYVPAAVKAAQRGRYLRLLGTYVQQRHEAEVEAQRFGVLGR